MKYILIIAILITSCNPFISKDLRRKNKCNRKVERELKRHSKKITKISINCPEILQNDTIRDTIEIEIKKIEIDSFITVKRDTDLIDSLVNLIENKKTREVIRKYIVEYAPFKDTVIHLMSGFKVSFYSIDGNIHYSIDKPLEVIKKEVKVIVTKVGKIKLTFWEKIMNGTKDFWWIALIFIALILSIKWILSLIPKKD